MQTYNICVRKYLCNISVNHVLTKSQSIDVLKSSNRKPLFSTLIAEGGLLVVNCSEKLRALREARGLTQMQVANRIGVSKSMVSAYETAAKTPSIEVLIRFSNLYCVSVDYLVCIDAPKLINVSGLDDDSVALVAALVKKLEK